MDCKRENLEVVFRAIFVGNIFYVCQLNIGEENTKKINHSASLHTILHFRIEGLSKSTAKNRFTQLRTTA